MSHVVNDWLPPGIAAQVAEVEPGRFSRVVVALQQTWEEGKGKPGGGGTLKWVPIINNFVGAKSDLRPEDVARVAETALDVIHCSTGELFTQIRWMGCLAQILRRFRCCLTLTIEWEPLFDLLLSHHFQGRPGLYKGAVVSTIHLASLVRLIKKSRRYFDPAAGDQIWAQLRPSFSDLSNNKAVEGAVLLSLFFPTASVHSLSYSAQDWSLKISEWVALWGLIPHSPYWDVQWLSLLARCAKHIPQPINVSTETPSEGGGGRRNPPGTFPIWAKHTPTIFQNVLNGLGLPVGQSLGSTSAFMKRTIPPSCVRVANSEAYQGKAVGPGRQTALRSSLGAKLIVWLIPHTRSPAAVPSRKDPMREAAAAASVDKEAAVEEGEGLPSKSEGVALAQLVHLVGMLEQFYHPSNGGDWNPALQHFLGGLSAHFLKLLHPSSSGMAPTATEAEHFVAAGMRLVHRRGLHSKHAGLAEAASHAAASFAYVTPSVVLPLVLDAFQSALMSDTASDQTEAAIATLSLSVRPLFLAFSRHTQGAPGDMGVVTESEEGLVSVVSPEMIDRCQAVMEDAMGLVLSGIDANDPPKTLATLKFYLSVFSSMPPIEGESSSHATQSVPLLASFDWSSWLSGLLSRLFSLFSHLEETKEGTQSFLLNADQGALLPPLLQEVFSKLPPSLQKEAISATSRFLRTSGVLPAAVEEIGTLCSSLANISPKEASSQLLSPLIESTLSLLDASPSTSFASLSATPPDLTRPSPASLSSSLRTAVCFHLDLLSSAVVSSSAGASLAPLRPSLFTLLQSAFNAPSAKITRSSATLLQNLLFALLTYFPHFSFVHSPDGSTPGAPKVAMWVPPKSAGSAAAAGAMAPRWHIPGTEEIGFASELMQLHLVNALEDARWLCKVSRGYTTGEGEVAESGSGSRKGSWAEEKDAWAVVLLRICHTLSGLRTSLPDIPPADAPEGTQASLEGAALNIIGTCSAKVGTAALRSEAAATIHECITLFVDYRADDVSNLGLLVQAADSLSAYGADEYGYALHYARVLRGYTGDLSEPIVGPPGQTKALLSPSGVVGAGVDASGAAGSHGGGSPPSEIANRRLPPWLLAEKSFGHLLWRTSQSRYRVLLPGQPKGSPPQPPAALQVLFKDLVYLSTYGYEAVQKVAHPALERMLKRFPGAVEGALDHFVGLLRDPKEGLRSFGYRAGEVHLSTVELDLLAAGACAVLSTRVMMRRTTQNRACMAAFMSGLLGSFHYDNPKAQEALSQLFLALVIRFLGCPSAFSSSLESLGSTPGTPTIEQLTVGLLQLTPFEAGTEEGKGKGESGAAPAEQPSVLKAGQSGSGMAHWRYTLMSDTFLFLLQSPAKPNQTSAAMSISGDGAGQLSHSVAAVSHFTLGLISPLPPIRAVSAVALPFLLPSLPNDLSLDSIVGAISKGSFGAAFIQGLAAVGGAAGGGGAGGGGPAAGLLQARLGTPAAIRGTFLSSSPSPFPSTKWDFGPNNEASFDPHTALLVQTLCFPSLPLCGPFLAALKEPLCEAAASRDPDMNRAAAAIWAGLLQCGHPSVLEVLAPSTAGIEPGLVEGSRLPWLLELIESATLAARASEAAGAWLFSVRYALTQPGAVSRTGDSRVTPEEEAKMALVRRGQALLRQIFLQPLPASSSSTLVTRRLTLLGIAVAELSPADLTEERAADVPPGDAFSSSPPSPTQSFLLGVLRELDGHFGHRARQVREQWGLILGITLSAVSDAGRSVDSGGGPGLSNVEAACRQLVTKLVEQSRDAAVVMEKHSSTVDKDGEPAADVAMGEPETDSTAQRQAVWNLETMLFFVTAAIKSGSVSVAPVLSSLLGTVLSIQDVDDDDLSLLAKQALALMKLQPMGLQISPKNPADTQLTTDNSVVSALSRASLSPNWKTRLASLSFTQAFVFRHAFILPGGAFRLVQKNVVRLLGDPQPEVQESASSSLAGLLRVSPDPEWATALKERLKSESKRALKAAALSRKRSKSGAKGQPPPPPTPQGDMPPLSCALGLAAFARSTPYDVPSWLPEIVMLLCELAHLPDPVSKAAKNALADFRHTHTDSWHIHKEAFAEEDLERLAGLTSPAGYFV